MTTFQLTRLILIDSFSPERIVELPLDGGAVLTGRNGRGKTSLLQLLMLFYGESPNRIVTAEAGRESFIGYYLPRSTSYIVFEYQRADGGKRMVVAYADKHGELIRYRFVRHGFDVTQFVTADNQIVQAPELVRHLKLHGFDFAEWQVETTADYRNIIQGIPSGSTNRQHQQQMRLLLQDYAFTSAKQSLRQVEKIVSGMFRRKTNFDDLQSMVIDCVSDEAVEHSISGDRRKIEDWPKGYRAYTGVMAHAPKMASVLQAEDKLLAVEDELAQVRAKYASLHNHLEQQLQLANKQINELEQLLNEENSQFQNQQSTLTAQRSTAQSAAEFAEKKAAALKQQFDDYAAKNMPQLDQRLNSQPLLQQDLSNLRQRKAILLGEQEKISLRYDQLKQQENEAFNAYREQTLAQQQQIRRYYDSHLHELENSFVLQQQQQREANELQRHILEQAKHHASAEQGRCSALLQQPVLDAAILAAVEQKQITLEAIRQETDKQGVQRRELERACLSANHAFAEQEQQISSVTRQLQHAEQVLRDKRALLAPDEGTLLHFLKHSHPAWGSDVAKVINPDLLQRSDLQPGLAEQSNSIYGLMLNLERIEAHPAAHANSAEQAVASAEHNVAQLHCALSAAKAKLEERAKQREHAEQLSQQHERLMQSLALKLKAAQDEVDVARQQLEQHRKQALLDAAQSLEQAQAALQLAEKQLKEFDQQTRVNAETQRQQYQQKRNELQQKCQAETQEIEHNIAARKQSLVDKLQQLDTERDQALQQQGVDTNQLKQLDGEVQHVQQEIAAIDSFAEVVKKWRYWLEKEWPAYDEHTAQAQQARATEANFIAQLTTLTNAWQARQKALQAQRQMQLNALNQMQTQLQQTHSNLEALLRFGDMAVPDYDAAWTLDYLTAQKTQLQQHARTHEDDIRNILADMAKGFRLYVGTPPEQYLQTTIHAISATPCREWIKPFKRWFDSEHQEYKRVLLMEAVSIAGEVQSFHATMSKFHLRVSQFNRELQEHLDTSLAFESISHLSVEVVSTLHELKYWGAICDMAEAYRDWNSGLSNELPPLEFALNIEQLLEHWEVKSGIRADLINLIRLQGEVVENGNRRIFKRASDLEVVSSNGLSYLILATIFVAFINRIRRDAPVNIVWALDELKDLDAGNVVGLMDLLRRNNITLVSAFPDPDPDTLALFRHRFTIEPDRRLARVELAEVDTNWVVEG